MTKVKFNNRGVQIKNEETLLPCLDVHVMTKEEVIKELKSLKDIQGLQLSFGKDSTSKDLITIQINGRSNSLEYIFELLDSQTYFDYVLNQTF